MADKLVVAVALVLLLSKDLTPVFGLARGRTRMLLSLTAIVIIGREIAISALREWMAEIGQRGKVAVSAIGKYKTILQIVGLSMMLYRWDLFGLPIFSLGRRAHGDGRRAHPDLDDQLPARRLAGAGSAGKSCESTGIFCPNAGRFALTSQGRHLQSRAPPSMRE